eukprot:scaffold8714_cov52-Phaeocystis_antarctica.AAC.1
MAFSYIRRAPLVRRSRSRSSGSRHRGALVARAPGMRDTGVVSREAGYQLRGHLTEWRASSPARGWRPQGSTG